LIAFISPKKTPQMKILNIMSDARKYGIFSSGALFTLDKIIT